MIRNEEITKLKKCARHFAMMMDDDGIEEVIVQFVGVKLDRDRSRPNSKCKGEYNRQPR